MDLFDLTRQLINIPSITGHEHEIMDFLSGYIENLGFELREQKIEEGRRNLLARASSKPEVILSTHVDTVAPYISASEDEHFISGRGACDAKGILASMIWAARELKVEGLSQIGLLFVVGEETDSIGAKMANSLNLGSKFIIVGEPTENKLGIGHKGMLRLKLIARGKAAHSAYPQMGESAIETLLDVLQKLRAIDFGKEPKII